jgi:uncharacterized membrane protein YdjX (TVP38/TMEM64 family)
VDVRQLVTDAGPAGVLAIMALALPPIGSIILFWAMATTELGPWLRSHGTLGPVLFAVAFALLAGIAVLPTYAQCALAGWAFGFWTGLGASLFGFCGGAAMGFLLARRASGDRIEAMIAREPHAAAIRQEFLGPPDQRPGFWRTLGLITLLRFPTNSPFALTNLLLASVRVPWGPYLLGTLLGMIPRSALAVFIGALIQQAFSKAALASAAPTWVIFAAIGSAVVVMAVFGWMGNRALSRLTPPTPAA